jgi:putative ABC transport system permease protein
MRLLPIEYAVRNLGRSAVRLTLSVFGGFMVVLLVLGAGGFVRGMTLSLGAAADERNVLVVGVGSEESLERSEIPASTASVLRASVPGLGERMGVPLVSAEVHAQLPVGVGSADRSGRLILVRGVTPTALLVHSRTQIVEGRFPVSGQDELLAGTLAHVKLGVPAAALAVGKRVMIEGRAWIICGRLAAPNSIIGGELWMPLADLKELTKRETDSCVAVTLDGGAGSAEFADVRAFCRQRLDLEITAMPEAKYYSRLAAFFAPIRAVTWATAGLIALGGVLGGLNTMYAAFASRVRELGMLQCLGYRRLAIVWSLVQESCLATATGGLLACGAALWLLDGVAVQFSTGAFGLRIDSFVVMLGVATGLVLGVLGALPPAIRCLRLPIPESLKSI